MNIAVTFKIKEEHQDMLCTSFPTVQFQFGTSIQEINIEHVQVIVTYGEDIDLKILQKASQLEWLMVASAGLDKLPLQEIAKRQIIVTNVKGIHKIPMAESVMAHLLALTRGLPVIYQQQQEKVWNQKIKTAELNGTTALIVGPGAIGSEIGKMLQVFGVKTIGCNRSGNQAPYMEKTVKIQQLQTILPDADIVISVLPSTTETRYLFTKEHFQAMKQTAIFMNFGRGDVVSSEVLIDALRGNLIQHAVLDVFEEEPLPETHDLWNLPNVTISPHISSHSRHYIPRALTIFSRNLTKWLAGKRKLDNQIDLMKGY